MRFSTMAQMFLVFICLGYGIQAEADETPFPGQAVNSPELVNFTLSSDGTPKPKIKVLESSDSTLLLEFDLPQLCIQELDVEGQTFHALEIQGGAYRGAEGDPMLPTFSGLVQIPAGLDVTFEVETFESTELAGYRPVPMQGGGAQNFIINNDAYAQLGYNNTPRVQIGEPAIARDLRVVPITFSPVRYNPAENQLEVAHTVTARITFGGENRKNAEPRFHRVIPESFHNLYEDIVVNYEGPRNDQTIGLGMVVIICPNNSTIVNYLGPLVEWRERKGHEVYLATTSETGTSSSSIKNWIQTKYNTWDNPPAYIVLVGDSHGSVSLPTYIENNSGYNGEGDHPYVQLDGGDILADAHIGRISVSSSGQVQTYVNKVLNYERTPYMSATSWYKEGAVCGDPSTSGYTCVQLMQWLKRQLQADGYTTVDTIFTSPWVTQMRNSINDGCTVFGYRGYLGMSGLNTGEIDNLSNGRKLPYAVISTCGSGDFHNDYAHSEAFMRHSNGGGIASVGTATWGTHTRYNNCVTYGIWAGALGNNPTLGASLTRGKYELYYSYNSWESGAVFNFTHWHNLMGDPACELWTDIPEDFAVSYDSNIAVGSTSTLISVADGSGACPGAYVCLQKDDDGTHVGGYTNYNGQIELQFNEASSGSMLLTVTKHNHKPELVSINISQQSQFVSHNAHSIDGNGQANPGEAIALDVQVKNFGTSTASSVNGTISTSDPYVSISDNYETYGNVSGGGTAWSAGSYNLTIDGGAPNGHVIQLGLNAVSGANNWRSLIELPVVAASFTYVTHSVSGVGTRLDPGESGQLQVSINNDGAATGSSVTGTLISDSHWISVTDANGSFGSINVGSTGNNSSNLFGVSAASDCFDGHQANMRIRLEFSSGAVDTVSFVLPVGLASSNDPTGPDAYGYYAFDNTDTSYDQAPTYSWVEIASNYGGPGSSLGLDDFGTAQDDSKVITLPFDFTYYGETFTKATICSNGWMAMGSTHLTNYRNWNLPAAGAPANMIAPMWDNLYQSGSDRVYVYNDIAQHRYIVQWSRMKNMYPSSHPTSTFQVILLDPDYYETETGDGIIIFQYATFNNSDYQQMYSSVGIQNADNSTAVLYSYFNWYNTGAATISSGRAIKFTPLTNFPSGTFSGHVANATNGNSDLEGATVRLVETGQTITTGSNGLFSSAVQTGTYTVTVTHPSFDPVTIDDVPIYEDQNTVRNFALDDILAPIFTGTTELGNTANTQTSYTVYTNVSEYSDFDELNLYYSIANAPWQTTPLTHLSGDEYRGSIPPASYTSEVRYYLLGRDTAANQATDPPSGASAPYSFWVMEPTLDDDIEGGVGGWTHEVATSGYSDQWHISTERNHSLGGTNAWKFGDTGDGNYIDMADGALISEPFDLESGGSFTFWHWMQAEVSGEHAGQAYDGGFVEMSVDGGAWEQISPVDGYPYQVREGSGPGPYPAGTLFYSGEFSWTQAQFELVDVSGTVQLRFRFGSDGNTNEEGWYIDDLYLFSYEPNLSDATELELRPERMMLYQNQPNPFSLAGNSTMIHFDLQQAARVELEIFDTLGRLVKTLLRETQPAGRNAVSWDGRDSNNHQVGSGVYYYVLHADRKQQSRQMLILK